MASKGRKSSLMTPDPYHIPGYCGYVPQFKYKLGETFGWHTHKLLTDKSVASSGHPVLADTDPTLPPPPKTQEDFFRSAIGSRTRSWGNQKYAPQMVPGYTGKRLECRNSPVTHYNYSSSPISSSSLQATSQRGNTILAFAMQRHVTMLSPPLKLTSRSTRQRWQR